MLSSLLSAPSHALPGWKTQPPQLLGAGVALSVVGDQAEAPRVSHFRAGEANEVTDEVTDHPGQAAAGTGVAAPRVRWNSFLHASLLIQLKMHWTTSTETLQVNSSSLLCCGEATLPPEFTSTQLSAISQGRKYPGCKMVLWL